MSKQTERGIEPAQGELELVRYQRMGFTTDFSVDPSAETVWATQPQIADVFGVDRTVVAKHLRNIFAEDELDQDAVCANFAHTAADGKTYQVQHYNLDAVLSVGYRVNSKKATEFRKWATGTLRAYLIDGYALNENRLKNDPNALRKLAARIRELRSSEKQIYAAVRQCFKISSTDYNPSAQECRTFYAKLQDKFLYAITSMTASGLILDRADHREPNMGLTVVAGDVPTLDDATVGKNYLDHNELYTLHILCEQFLLFAESKAMRGKKLMMSALAQKLDDLLRTNEYPVFQEYKTYLKDRAIEHAKRELVAYNARQYAIANKRDDVGDYEDSDEFLT